MASATPRLRAALAAGLCLFAFPRCTRRAAPSQAAVVAAYAELVERTYADAVTHAERLQAAVGHFVAVPSASRLEAAKRAWLDAHAAYGLSEAFRFSGGPIDADGGPEPLINGWPLDESYIDYVDGRPASGIVNDPTITLAPDRLVALNEAGGTGPGGAAFAKDTAIATGYHAIEFLLWGQDHDELGPGARPWQDYVEPGQGGTAPNAARRGRYLTLAAELLATQLRAVHAAWDPTTGDYRRRLLAGDPRTALRAMLTGMGVLTKGELASERIDVALDTQDQEDEQSCFSDSTQADLVADAQSLRNVYLGTFGTWSGPSLGELVAARDAALDGRLRELLARAVDGAVALPPPFDHLVRDRNGPGWKAADELVRTLYRLGDELVAAGRALELGDVATALPE
jgi:putative iron-regulated protein